LVAGVLLPDHAHLVITLPSGDTDFSTRIGALKARFTHQWLSAGGPETPQSTSRERQEYRGVWQKRFWEHVVRDEDDLAACCDYVHYNPVKHGYVACPHLWEWTTFHRWVRERRYEADWCCACDAGGANPRLVIPRDIRGAEMDS
jgi:putative transposase